MRVVIVLAVVIGLVSAGCYVTHRRDVEKYGRFYPCESAEGTTECSR